MDFVEHMKRLNSMMMSAMALADDYNNPTGKGDFRELQLANILRDKLPDNLIVSKGEIFDSDGKRTPEFDIIIHLRSSSPRFFSLGDRKVIPCEDVLAVGEVKSQGDPKAFAQFKDGLEKLNQLSRYYQPTEIFQTMSSTNAKKFVGTAIKANQDLLGLRPIVGFFFAYKSAKSGTILDNIKNLDSFPSNNLGFHFPNNCSILNIRDHGGWVATTDNLKGNVLFTLVTALNEYCGDDVRTLNVRTDTKRYNDYFLKDHA